MENFKNLIKEGVEKKMKGGEVRFTDVTKTNDVKLTGIMYVKNAENVFPTVYLESFFEDFKRGVPLKSIINKISDILEENQVREKLEVKEFFNKHYIFENVFFQIISTKMNQNMLEEVPSRKMGDFSKILKVRINEEATFPLTKHHLMELHIDEDELFEQAEKNNLKFYKPCFGSILDAGLQILDEITSISIKEPDMYVLTNQEMYTGASVIYYDGVLKKVCDLLQTSELILIPSSIHEIIILNGRINKEGLDDIIKSVNRDSVRDDEVLGDRAYYYHLNTDTIE